MHAGSAQPVREHIPATHHNARAVPEAAQPCFGGRRTVHASSGEPHGTIAAIPAHVAGCQGAVLLHSCLLRASNQGMYSKSMASWWTLASPVHIIVAVYENVSAALRHAVDASFHNQRGPALVSLCAPATLQVASMCSTG